MRVILKHSPDLFIVRQINNTSLFDPPKRGTSQCFQRVSHCLFALQLLTHYDEWHLRNN